MAFRKLKYKHVLATRSNEVLKSGEVAVENNSLYFGDGSTTGGNALSVNTNNLPTLTVNQNTLSSNSGSPTSFDPDVYSAVFITHTPNTPRYITIPDGTYNGQTITISQHSSGGHSINGVGIKQHDTDGNSTTSSNQGKGRWTWNGDMWFHVAF